VTNISTDRLSEAKDFYADLLGFVWLWIRAGLLRLQLTISRSVASTTSLARRITESDGEAMLADLRSAVSSPSATTADRTRPGATFCL
jgi:hypothetical protein